MGGRSVPEHLNVGIGLRAAHHADLLERRPPLDFVEVHSENFFADGGAGLAVLREARATYPVSLHGVGLGLGSATGLDPWHLDRLERLVDRIDPVRVSDHACFARVTAPAGTAHAADLLPIAFNDATLALMVSHVTEVQERLRRPMLVENLAHGLAFEDDTMAEPEFFARLCAASGCGMLLDLNNLMVAALNAVSGRSAAAALEDALAYVAALPPGIVDEIHLAGHDDRGARVVDDHGSRVRPTVWRLFEAAVRRFGGVPALVEWDADLPPLDVLLGEAAHARALQASARAVR